MMEFAPWKAIVFLLASVLLATTSWASLRKARSHGFFRFFAWECILALFLLNVQAWFVDPLSWHQCIAWALLVACLVPLALGVRALRSLGRPESARPGDPSLLSFEKTTRLVTTGIYAYIRHPLYSSLLLLAWGIFFKSPGLYGALLAAGASLFLVATARADERECLLFFGEDYRRYMQHTRRFLPYLF